MLETQAVSFAETIAVRLAEEVPTLDTPAYRSQVQAYVGELRALDEETWDAHLRSGRWRDLRGVGDRTAEVAFVVVVVEQVEIMAKYSGYIDRQKLEIDRAAHYEHLKLPQDLDYHQVSALSFEARQTLAKHRPETLGLASRISGVTPATISLLLVYLKKGRGRTTESFAGPPQERLHPPGGPGEARAGGTHPGAVQVPDSALAPDVA